MKTGGLRRAAGVAAWRPSCHRWSEAYAWRAGSTSGGIAARSPPLRSLHRPEWAGRSAGQERAHRGERGAAILGVPFAGFPGHRPLCPEHLDLVEARHDTTVSKERGPGHEGRVVGHKERDTKSGDDNELWSFGERVYGVLRRFAFFRQRLRPTSIEAQLARAASSGEPPMRPLWFDDPDDAVATAIDDEYLFGPDVLVAPVLEPGAPIPGSTCPGDRRGASPGRARPTQAGRG